MESAAWCGRSAGELEELSEHRQTTPSQHWLLEELSEHRQTTPSQHWLLEELSEHRQTTPSQHWITEGNQSGLSKFLNTDRQQHYSTGCLRNFLNTDNSITALAAWGKLEWKQKWMTFHALNTGMMCVKPDPHWHWFKGNLGETAERQGWSLWAFPITTLPSWAETGEWNLQSSRFQPTTLFFFFCVSGYTSEVHHFR